MADPQQGVIELFSAGAILAVAAGLPALLIYARVRKDHLFPRPAEWTVSWDWRGVLLAFIVLSLVPFLFHSILSRTAFFQTLYGADFPAGAGDLRDPAQRHATNLRFLWSLTLAVPFEIVLILAVLKFGIGATVPQTGLTRQRLGSNVVLGYLGWLLLTPLAFAVYILAMMVLAPTMQKHPLMDLGPLAGTREMFVQALQTALLAPALEELVFRGVLLPWSMQEPKLDNRQVDLIIPLHCRPHVCFAASFVIPLQNLTDAVNDGGWREAVNALEPVLFFLAMIPFYLLLRFSKRLRGWLRLSSPQTAQACFANGVLFGAIHLSLWPSPIPLVVLGFGLAWLAARTRSIIPCIVAHGLFNGVAMIYMHIGGPT